jgi:malonyl-CoA decarboxylase
MPNDPLIFVWVALTHGIPDNIQNLLSIQGAEVELGEANTAVFYSISATQAGLDGVGLGSFLIKRVVDRLSRDHKQLKEFSTLSPIPGFASWLQELTAGEDRGSGNLSDAVGWLQHHGDLNRIFSDRSWVRDLAAVDQVREPLLVLCTHYLMEAKRGESALDPVANFHLSNGASIERLNWLGDTSKRGQLQSACLMVNYRYRLKDIESNHEAYHTDGKIVCAKSISGLLKT